MRGAKIIILGFGNGWLNLLCREGAKHQLKSFFTQKSYELHFFHIRKVQDSWSALNEAGNPTGNACFASGWYDYLTKRVNDMIRQALAHMVIWNHNYDHHDK